MSFGIDISKIDRFEKYLDDKKFLNRILTEEELKIYSTKGERGKLEFLSGRFSSKEALSKALGTGIGQISFKDIEILNLDSGKPIISLKGRALKKWNEKFLKDPLVSISHDGNYVVTLVIGKKKDLGVSKTMDLNPPFPLMERKREGHKGTFGRVGILGGSKGMLGSIYLSSMAALKTGSGLVYSGVPREIFDLMQIKSTENIVREMDWNKESCFTEFSKDLDALGLGPGMGKSLSLKNLKGIFQSYNGPIILDADGINLLSQDMDLLKYAKNVVLTPHPGEFSRLLGKPIDIIEKNRWELSKEFAKKYSIILILKGHNTIVTDGLRIYENKTGTSGLGTAGSGDVLTGILTSLMGQGYSLYEGCCLGVYIHGLCGNFLEESIGSDGIIASDIFNEIPYVIKALRER